MKKTVVWFIGSNCSGKTTQSRLLHKRYGNDAKEIQEIEFEDKKTFITTFGSVAHIGAVRDNQCTGTDTLNSREQIEYAYYTALDDPNIDFIIIDGIMATGQWSGFINIIPVNGVVVLLDYVNLQQNLSRLAIRRANKKGIDPKDVVFDDKTLKNIESKINIFRRLFARVQNDFSTGFVCTADSAPEAIHSSVVNAIEHLKRKEKYGKQ